MNAIQHLAIIMDGNGRWAERRHLPRLMGHKAGADALDRTMHNCRDAGIKYLTVYAFSTENWKRSQEEVSGLMNLLSTYIHSKERELIENGVRFRVIGRRSDLSEKLQNEIAALEKATEKGDFTLLVALSYGGRDEIVRAVEKMLEERDAACRPRLQGEGDAACRPRLQGEGDAACRPRLQGEGDAACRPRLQVTEQVFSRYLDAPDVPDPDLIIRTSGEQRTSNFLLWESAYSEYYFTNVLWPDFDRAEFDKALASFGTRQRRMGGR